MSAIKYQEPTNATEPKVGDLRVWWNPQIGGRVPQIHFPVATVHEAQRLLDALARYDLFQLEHRVKGDYANVGGLEEFVEHAYDEATDGTKPGWQSWERETDDDFFEDPRVFVEKYPLEDAFHEQLCAAKVILHRGDDAGEQLRVGATTGVGSDMQILLEPI